MNKRGFSPIWILVIAAFVLAIGAPLVFRDLRLAPKSTQPVSVVTTTVPVVTAPQAATTTIVVPNSSMNKFPFTSLDGKYIFNLYAFDGGCIFRVIDNRGNEVDLSNVVDTYNITCSADEELYSDFVGWADGNKFLLRGKSGEVKVVDIKHLTMGIHQYDGSQYYIDAANRSLKYWLFQHDEGGGDFTILDASNTVVLGHLSGYRYGLYDPVNDGFVFMAKDEVGTKVSLRVDYLFLSDLKLQNILKTDPVEPPGRGCGGPSLSSKPGEIMIGPGCIFVDIKYFDLNDISIHIKLPSSTQTAKPAIPARTDTYVP